MESDQLLPRLEIGASLEEAELTVILMHGLGADGNDFADVAEALSRAALPRKWRFVLPHAPHLPVTINNGVEMPAWYDIVNMDLPREVEWDSVEASQAQIEALIAQEKAKKIVVAGFSQGGAMSLHVGLRHDPPLAGILSMSGYLLETEDRPCPPLKEGQSQIPIGIFHGTADPVVLYAAAERTMEALTESGHKPTLKSYEGLQHSVHEEELRDVFAWLEGI